jgi:hypothetical protein
MFSMAGVPPTIASGMKNYREVFCRDAGFERVSRYVSGLELSENKTLEAIHAQQVWPEGKEVSRRAMHAAVFEGGWSSEGLMVKHRAEVSRDHQAGRGREVRNTNTRPQSQTKRSPKPSHAIFTKPCSKRRNVRKGASPSDRRALHFSSERSLILKAHRV